MCADIDEAFDVLSSESGRTLVTPEFAVNVMHPFYDAEGVLQHGDTGDMLDDIAEMSEMARDVHAMTHCFPWEPVLGICDITEKLVKRLDQEHSTGLSAGTGSNADERHTSNLKTIRSVIYGSDVEA